MRAWRSPTGFLVDRGPTSTPVISDLLEELPGGPWRELREFASLAPDGVVRTQYRVSVWSIDDDLGVSTHAVIDGELRCLTVVASYSGRVRREEEKVVSDLQEVSDLTFVQEALARHERGENEAIERIKAEDEARVAAIPGALEDFNAGDPFRTAQTRLVDRVKLYGDDLCADLLRTLAEFGRLHRTLGKEPAFTAALDAYVNACRLATFEPVRPKASRSPGGIDARELRELKQSLARLQQQLLDEAAGQEEADARLNAIEYRKAAAQVGRALGFFGPPPL